MIDKTISDIASAIIKNRLAPETQTVVHKYDQPAPSPAHYGSPEPYPVPYEEPAPQDFRFAEEEPFEIGGGFGEPLRAWGAQKANEIRQAALMSANYIPGGAQGSYGEPGAYGAPNPIGWIRDQVVGSANAIAGGVEAVSGKTAQQLDKVEDDVRRVISRLMNVERKAKTNSQQVASATRRSSDAQRTANEAIRRLDAMMKGEEEMTKEQIEQTLLALAQSLPGVYTHNQLNGTAHAGLVDVIGGVGEAFADDVEGDATALTIGALTDAAASYDATNIDTITGEITDNVETLLDAVNDLRADFYGLRSSVNDLEVADAVADWRQVVLPNSILTIAKLMPHSLQNTTQAVLEGLAKSVFGKPASGGSLFNLTLGL